MKSEGCSILETMLKVKHIDHQIVRVIGPEADIVQWIKNIIDWMEKLPVITDEEMFVTQVAGLDSAYMSFKWTPAGVKLRYLLIGCIEYEGRLKQENAILIHPTARLFLDTFIQKHDWTWPLGTGGSKTIHTHVIQTMKEFLSDLRKEYQTAEIKSDIRNFERRIQENLKSAMNFIKAVVHRVKEPHAVCIELSHEPLEEESWMIANGRFAYQRRLPTLSSG